MRLQSVQRRESFEKAIRIRKPMPNIMSFINFPTINTIKTHLFNRSGGCTFFQKQNAFYCTVRTIMNSFFF